MPRANDAGASNGLLQRIEEFYKSEEAKLSAGISSLTSGEKQDSSGPLTTDTASFPQSPVHVAESPSSPDPQVDQVQSSTADSTSGSTQETGPSPASPPTSSEESTATSEPPTDQPSDPAKAADDLISLARAEYNKKDYAKALELVNDAEALFPGIRPTADQARQAIEAAQASATTS